MDLTAIVRLTMAAIPNKTRITFTVVATSIFNASLQKSIIACAKNQLGAERWF
jgi:hypothetical protein